MTEPELIADEQCVTGEGPLWHEDEARLYWADIPNGRLFRYDPVTGTHETAYQAPTGHAIGGYTIQADGALLLFGSRGRIEILRGGAVTPVLEEIPGEEDSRFNDVIADPEGRVFCGTMPANGRLGRLYRLDPDGTLTQLLDGIDISNGMGFTPDGAGMYYTESNRRVIYRFDYDRASGALRNQRVFVRTPDDGGIPDGMAVDVEGYVWSARWDGNALYRYAPDGILDRRVEFPPRKVSSITFGGPDYATAYVTTAGGNNRPAEGAGAGSLFRVDLGVRGRPPFRSRIQL